MSDTYSQMSVSSPSSSSSSLSTSSFVRSLTFFVSPRTLCDGKLLPFVASLSLLSHGPGHVTPPYTPGYRWRAREERAGRRNHISFICRHSVLEITSQCTTRLASPWLFCRGDSEAESEADCYCCVANAENHNKCNNYKGDCTDIYGAGDIYANC